MGRGRDRRRPRPPCEGSLHREQQVQDVFAGAEVHTREDRGVVDPGQAHGQHPQASSGSGADRDRGAIAGSEHPPRTEHRHVPAGPCGERTAHGDILVALDVDAPRVRIGGKTFTRISREPGTYKTTTGPEVVERTVYRELGVRNGPVVDAINAARMLALRLRRARLGAGTPLLCYFTPTSKATALETTAPKALAAVSGRKPWVNSDRPSTPGSRGIWMFQTPCQVRESRQQQRSADTGKPRELHREAFPKVGELSLGHGQGRSPRGACAAGSVFDDVG